MPIRYHYGQFPPKTLDWEKLIPLIGPTSAAIAHYDGILSAIPNANILLSPLTTQEAVLSSRIEGTQATMGEVLKYEASGDVSQYDQSRRDDIFEIINYRKALHEAENLLHTLPLSQRFIKNIHKILLSGVRGKNKDPGEYRKIPNWIGPHGCAIEEAYFIPISADKLQTGMDLWENFIHEKFLDVLVQLAILHVELEALHPFLDGNGRLGRIFVPLFLWQKSVLSKPTFYISAVFENDRATYYNKLRGVSEKNLWTEWCIYFLNSMKVQAEANADKAKSILALYEEMKNTLPSVLSSQYVIQALDWIFRLPMFSGSIFVHEAGIPEATARRILPTLVKNNILKILEKGHGRRAALYCFPKLLNLAEGRECF